MKILTKEKLSENDKQTWGAEHKCWKVFGKFLVYKTRNPFKPFLITTLNEFLNFVSFFYIFSLFFSNTFSLP